MKLWTWVWKPTLPGIATIAVDGWGLYAGGMHDVASYRLCLCHSEEEAIKQMADYAKDCEKVVIYLGDVEFEPIDEGE